MRGWYRTTLFPRPREGSTTKVRARTLLQALELQLELAGAGRFAQMQMGSAMRWREQTLYGSDSRVYRYTRPGCAGKRTGKIDFSLALCPVNSWCQGKRTHSNTRRGFPSPLPLPSCRWATRFERRPRFLAGSFQHYTTSFTSVPIAPQIKIKSGPLSHQDVQSRRVE